MFKREDIMTSFCYDLRYQFRSVFTNWRRFISRRLVWTAAMFVFDSRREKIRLASVEWHVSLWKPGKNGLTMEMSLKLILVEIRFMKQTCLRNLKSTQYSVFVHKRSAECIDVGCTWSQILSLWENNLNV